MNIDKCPMALVPLEFVASMAWGLKKGIRGERKANDWKKMEWNDEMRDGYYSAMLRHIMDAQDEGYRRSARLKHIVAVANNAMILWWHELERRDK